jgi:hypothetical protein
MNNQNWYMGDFSNPSSGHPWTIPEAIAEITISFSS